MKAAQAAIEEGDHNPSMTRRKYSLQKITNRKQRERVLIGDSKNIRL